MFNKLKNQIINEKSSTDVIPIVTDTNSNSRINVPKSLDRVKSNQSDGNQSSDDSSSIKSQKELNDAYSKSKSLNQNRENVTSEKNEDNKQTFKENLNERDRENSIKSQLQDLNHSLLEEIDKLHIEINQKNEENENFRLELAKCKRLLNESENSQENMKFDLDKYQNLIGDYELEIKQLRNDKEELIIRNAELSEKYELLKLVNTKQLASTMSTNQNSIHHDIDSHNVNSSISNEYLEENKSLRDELNEKNKIIKNLQQRLNDMKKTLQKELKYHMLPNEKTIQEPSTESPVKTNTVLSNIQISPISSNTTLNNFHSPLTKKASLQSPSIKKNYSSSDMSALHEDVNFKYLKHVVLKFVTSREYEALHLVKALSVLLNLSKDEEKNLKETLEWKMSWFGSKPKLV